MKSIKVFSCCTDSNNPSIDDIIDLGLYKERVHKRINEMCDKPEPFVILTMDDNYLHHKSDEQIKEILTKFILSLDPDLRRDLLMGLAIHELFASPINE